MKLPNFASHPIFAELKGNMGVTRDVDWNEGFTWTGMDPEDWRKIQWQGLDVPMEDIQLADDGTLEYRGHKVIVYIRDQYAAPDGSAKEYKFHISDCDWIQKMRATNRLNSRYVVSRRNDGTFMVNLFQGKVLIKKDIALPMRVCKYCLTRLSYDGYSSALPRSEREGIFTSFSIDRPPLFGPLENVISRAS